MYLVGKLIRAINTTQAVTEPICIRWTRRGAERACLTADYYYHKLGSKPPKTTITPIFPRRHQ